MSTDYIESALHHRRAQQLDLRNERRRVVLERQERTTRARTRTRRSLSYVVRHRLAELLSDAPARG